MTARAKTDEAPAPEDDAAVTRPMGPVTARLAADPVRAEWLRRCVAAAPPMAAEDILWARRLIFTPTTAEVAARPKGKTVARPSAGAAT
jgi:hypothetical protein